MLVLSRKSNESIMIDHNIKITVLQATDHSVRIGISAPKNIKIHREEIYNLIQRRKKMMNKKSINDLCYIDQVAK